MMFGQIEWKGSSQVAQVLDKVWAKANHMKVNRDAVAVMGKTYLPRTLMVRVCFSRWEVDEYMWVLDNSHGGLRPEGEFVLPEMAFMSDLVEACL